MTYFSSYDSWKLDNGETNTSCDKCEHIIKPSENSTEGIHYDILCEICADEMRCCNRCGKYGMDEDFSYNADETCNNCIDLQVDKMTDND